MMNTPGKDPERGMDIAGNPTQLGTDRFLEREDFVHPVIPVELGDFQYLGKNFGKAVYRCELNLMKQVYMMGEESTLPNYRQW